MDEREAGKQRERETGERRDGDDRTEAEAPPRRPITEWPREAKERDGGDETPGVGVPPG